MLIRHSQLLTFAIGSITGFGLNSLMITSAGAQSYNFPDSYGGKYGLLNGDHLALYVNDRGDLGAPVRYGSATQKPMGIGNGLHPIVNSNGSVPDGTGSPVNGGPPADSGTYAALYSTASTSTAGPLQASIQAKSEYVSIGTSVLEGYGVYVPTQKTWLHNGSFTAGTGSSAFAVSGNIGGMLTATSQAGNTTSGITVGQTVAIDDRPGDKMQNIAVFSVTVTNTSGNLMKGVQYARVVNPNIGVPASTMTVQQLGTQTDPSAFAINATFPGSKNQLALGVNPLSSPYNEIGTTLFSTPTTTEDALFNGLGKIVTASNRVVLGASTAASYYLAGTTIAAANTLDYSHDTVFQNTVQFDQDPNDDALVLLSPTYDLTAGQSFSFSFSYYFDPPSSQSGNATPEPGAWTLIATCVLSGVISARRRTTRRQKHA